MMRCGSSLRGLSEVTTMTSLNRSGDGTHERTLRAIAIAAAAEHRDETPVRQRARGLQQVPQRVVGMRVVDDDRDFVFRARYDLEAARHAVERRQSTLDRVERQPERGRRGDRRENVVDVGPADERRFARVCVPRGVRTSNVRPSSENESGPGMMSAGRLMA